MLHSPKQVTHCQQTYYWIKRSITSNYDGILARLMQLTVGRLLKKYRPQSPGPEIRTKKLRWNDTKTEQLQKASTESEPLPVISGSVQHTLHLIQTDGRQTLEKQSHDTQLPKAQERLELLLKKIIR